MVGEISILGRTREPDETHELITIRTDPGSRTSTLVQKGQEYGEVLCTRKISDLQERWTMIGEECDLLGMVSPYTYIVKAPTLVYTIKVEHFYKELLNVNPIGLEQIKRAAAQKLKEFNQIAREKKEWDNTVATTLQSVRLAREKRAGVEQNVRKQYPVGDKPVI